MLVSFIKPKDPKLRKVYKELEQREREISEQVSNDLELTKDKANELFRARLRLQRQMETLRRLRVVK